MSSGRNVRIFNPRIDRWLEHFRWSVNGTVVKGITPSGRATVSLLKMNRTVARRIRVSLVAQGVHPPPRDVADVSDRD